MKTALSVLLIIHILSGFTALVSGGVSIFTPKGGKTHKKWGKAYYYAMISVGITAFNIQEYCFSAHDIGIFVVSVGNGQPQFAVYAPHFNSAYQVRLGVSGNEFSFFSCYILEVFYSNAFLNAGYATGAGRI